MKILIMDYENQVHLVDFVANCFSDYMKGLVQIYLVSDKPGQEILADGLALNGALRRCETIKDGCTTLINKQVVEIKEILPNKKS